MKINFKDELIQNKWLLYQQQLSLSLVNEYHGDVKIKNEAMIILSKLPQEQEIFDKCSKIIDEFYKKYGYNHKYFNCSQYHCMRSAYQYHKLSDTTKRSNYRQKNIKLKYDHFKNRKLTKKSLIKEHLWYNLKNEDSIIISGDSEKHTNNNNIKYIPKYPNSLKLNNMPVSYIEITSKNENDMKCNLLYFCFDMSSYCDIIDTILIMSRKKNKTNYFSYLPFDIINYILYLTSIE